MLTDGELHVLFTHGNSRAMQSIQSAETKRMIMGHEPPANLKRGKLYTVFIFLSGKLRTLFLLNVKLLVIYSFNIFYYLYRTTIYCKI